ncbi:uncharacterized protein LOC144656326 [Oculina patagonica]
MNQIGVQEQNNYFKMESINETEAESPTTKLTIEKFPQGAEKEEQPLKQHKNVCRSHNVEVRPAVQRLVFISIITAAVAFLASVVCLILTLMVMTSPNNSTPSKDVDETQGQNCREIHNVSVKNLLRRIEDLENNALATEAKMKVLQAQVNETANKVAIVDDVWGNMKNISNRAASLEKGYTQMNNLMKTLHAINGSQNASHQDVQSMYNRLRDSLNAVNTTLFDKVAIVDDVWVNMNNISNRAASLEKGYTQMNNLIKTLQAINSSQNASYQDLQSMYNRLSDSLTAVNATLFDKVAIVDDVWVNVTNTHDAFEKKLDTEFKQLDKSVKDLSNNDSEITSTVDELRLNQILTKRMNERLANNVTHLKSHVKELRKTSNNISNRAASLEKGYNQMNNLMITIQAINGAQNASHQDLQSVHNRLRDSLTTVNATLFDKLKTLGSNSGKPTANFSTCRHRSIPGTSTTASSISGTAEVFYREPKGQRAMGITCSTNVARHYQLSEVIQGPYKFRCTCKHLSPVFGSRSRTMNCYLHVWECPI